MSSERPEKAAELPDEPSVQEKTVSAPGEGMTRAERIFVRINIVQTILAVAGVFTGAVALYAALNESAAVRRQSEAAVWPIIQLYISDYISDDAAEFKVSLNNTGVGPGRMKSMRVRIDDVAAQDWPHVIELAVGDSEVRMSKSSITGRVIAAGESVDLFTVRDRDIVAALQTQSASGAAQIDFCYCSIFDSCWLYQSRVTEAERVKFCPDFEAEQFQE